MKKDLNLNSIHVHVFTLKIIFNSSEFVLDTMKIIDEKWRVFQCGY